LLGGINAFAYAGSNPLAYMDPLGLWWFGDPLPQGLVDFSAAWGDAVSFGITNQIRNAMGTNDVVDKCSAAYTAGEVFGIANAIAIGGAGGARSAAGRFPQFSHSMFPDRFLRTFDNAFARWFNRAGNRLNGDYLPTTLHALVDPQAYRFAPKVWKEVNDLFPAWRRALNRIPYLPGSAAYGAGSAAINGCDCKQ